MHYVSESRNMDNLVPHTEEPSSKGMGAEERELDVVRVCGRRVVVVECVDACSSSIQLSLWQNY